MNFYISRRKRYFDFLLTLLLAALLTLADTACARQLKFGPYAVPMTEKTGYLRRSLAPDYWRMSQFYLPQQTSSACGLASTAMILNFLIGVPQYFDETLITQPALVKSVFTGIWKRRVAEGGDGLKFDDLVMLANEALRYYNLQDKYTIRVIRPSDTPFTLADLQEVLSANEVSDADVLLAYYNQGVLTSDWDGPHISPVGAYNRQTGEVLMMDVDREWYVPYWSPAEKLLEAMLRPAPADQGILAGETGGLLWFVPIL